MRKRNRADEDFRSFLKDRKGWGIRIFRSPVKWDDMITDQAILRQIERQPNRSAGYKQLVREMSARGGDRRVLAERLAGAGQRRTADRNRARPLHPGRTRGGTPEPHRRAAQHASRRLRVRDSECGAAQHHRRRHLHQSASHRLGHARRPGAGGTGTPQRRWARRGQDPAGADAGESDRGGNISLRLTAQLRDADRREGHQGNRDSEGDGVSTLRVSKRRR